MSKQSSTKPALTRAIRLVAFAALALSISTCKGPLFGLGGAVDLEAPRSMSVVPGQGAFRNGVISISGVADDDYGLASAEVRILDRGSGAIIGSYSASISGDSWTTGSVVNTAAYPDGLYTVAVILKDARGNASEDRILVGFDNRAPTALIEEPLDLSLEYNGMVYIAGQAYDSISSIVSVTVQLYRADATPVGAPLVSATVPKWSVFFNASDPAFGLTDEDLTIEVKATDEGGNTNSYHYEYKALFDNNAGNPVTASLVDELDAKDGPSDTVGGLAFDKAQLEGYRSDFNALTLAPPSILRVNVDSDKPVFTFVTPGPGSTSAPAAERFAGGTKANGTVKDDDLNTSVMEVNYRYALDPAPISSASWNSATVEGTGYEQRWSFIMPGANGLYRMQLQAFDNAGAEAVSIEHYIIIDDGRPLVTLSTDEPTRLYYGRNQTIVVSGTADRDGVGNFIEDVEISVGSNPWTDVTGLSGLGTSNVTWPGHSLSLAGLAGGSTQIRVRARDNGGIWGQSEVLIIMDVDDPLISITPPGTNLNGDVNLRGTVEDGAGDAFITVLDRVMAKLDAPFTADPDDGTKITGTYSWLWAYNTQGIADGAHTLWIRAFDKAGNKAESSQGFTVSQASDKPVLAINNLSSGMVIGGNFVISGTAADDDGIASAADGIQILIENESSPGVWAEYQAWTDVTSRSGPQTNYSMTYALPGLPSGSYRLSLRARDLNSSFAHYGSAVLPQANYWALSASPLDFKVDNDVPVVNQASLSPAMGSYVNSGFTLSGDISEDQNLASVRIFINGTDRGAATISGAAPNYGFSAAIDQAWLNGAGGANSIRIDATDDSAPAKTGSSTIQIIFDDQAPTASFLSPASGSMVNGIITVNGLANDNNQVSALYYAVRADSLGGLPAYPADYTLLADQKYSFNFTLNTALLSDESSYTAYLVAVDAAGNHTGLAPEQLPLMISQSSDRPIVKLSNIRTDGSTVLKMVNTVFGSVNDDDGSVVKFETSEDGAVWAEQLLSGGTFSYDASAGDGPKTIFFRVTDAKGTIFSTSAATSIEKPRIETNPAELPAAYVDGPIAFQVDTAPPEINPSIMADRTALFDFSDEVALSTNMPFGGNSALFRLRAQASDSNGIAGVSFSVPGAPGSPYAAILDAGYYRTPTIDISGVADGPLVITIEATDNSGLKTSLTRTVIIDNSAPAVSFTNPRSLIDVVNGNIEVKGLASDGGSGLSSVQFKVGYNHAAQSWQDVGGSLFSWQVDFKDANRIDIYANLTDGSDDNGDDIWQVPVLIRAEDNAGNVYTSTVTDYILLVDPSGDKPKALIIYPDPASINRTLGGNIRIFGSAEDDDGVQAVFMQVDVNGDGLFDATDVASNGVDWYNAGEGQSVSGTVSWNRTINADQEFDPPGAGTRTIYFRVRARDIYGLDGAWSLPQRIDVDKNVPKIGSGIPLTLKQGGAELSYVADTWLKGSWSLVGSVEDESGIDSITISGDINGSLAANPTWFTNLGGDNYRFEIPLTAAASAGRVSFTITALDKSTPQLQTSLSLSVQADNQAPTLNAYTGALPIVQSNLAYTLASSLNESGSGFGKVAFYFVRRDRLGNTANDRVYMPMAGNSFTALSGLSLQDGLYYLAGAGATRPDEYTLVDADLIGNANVRVGGLVRIAGLDRRIVTWNGASGTLSWADEVDTGVTDYQIAYAQVVENQTVETPVYLGGVLTNIINDDGDGMVESVERSGGLYSWTASLDSRNIPDGPIELHWVSFDKAGNYLANSLTSSIANNRPLLAAVTLGTDLDGDGAVSAAEQVPAYSALDAEGNEQAIATIASSAFTAKGHTTADIDVVGGNGQLFYALSVGGADIHGGLQNLRSDGISPIETVEIGEAQLLAMGEGARSLVFTLWDSTEESLPGSTSLSAELTAPINVRLIDTVTPKVVINPFYWNASDDNSLYGDSKLNGHIELTGVIDGTDPDLSGQASIRGTAYDDQRLTSLWMAIDGFAFTGAGANGTQFDTDGDGALETLSRSYYRLASFSAGAWTGTDRWATDGWKFAVTPVSLGQDGHLVNWQLDWDSARVTNVAALNRVIRMLAQDKRVSPQANSSSETANPSGDVSAKNVPSYQVDVVPYIAKISTHTTGIKDANIRSASGRYSVKAGTADNFLTLTGFNLNVATARLSRFPVTANAGGTTVTITSTPAMPWTSVALRNDADRSGYLTLFTADSIPSSNNLNNNDLSSNREPDTASKNALITDDRYLSFFSVSDTGHVNGYYPVMKMEGDDPVFGFLNLSAQYDLQVRRSRVSGTTYNYPLIRSLYADQMAMAVDQDGMYYQFAVHNGASGSMFMIYNRYAEMYTATGGTPPANQVRTFAGAAQPYWSWYGGMTGENYYNNNNNNAIVLDDMDQGGTYLSGRFKNLQAIAKGRSNTAAQTASIYYMYYDAGTPGIIFRQFQTGRGIAANSLSTLTYDGVNYSNIDINIADSDANRSTAVAGGSQFYSFGVTDANRIVLAYYDEANAALKLQYTNTAQDGSNPAAAVTWTQNPNLSIDYVGTYVSIHVQTDGNALTADPIHIAAYDSAEGDLMYVYLDGYDDATPQTFRIDAYKSIGHWTEVKTDPTGRPYIAYYSSSENGTKDSIKLARFAGVIGTPSAGVDGSGAITGNWELMTIPVNGTPQGGIPQFQKVNLGFKADGTPVLGYLADDIEVSSILPELPD